MKETKDITCCICDYGYYTSLAEKLAQTYKKVYYHTPVGREYVDVKYCLFGEGIKNVERLDDFLYPDVLKEIDLFIFPDIGYSDVQSHLRDIGKAVWGSFEATELELYRTLFLEKIEELKLPIAPYKVITGLTKLSEHLKTVKDKWIKIDRYRGNMETWHHLDWEHSERDLESLAIQFGGAKEYITFVVQDDIKTKIENGYDGYCVDGQYPNLSFQGYEKKNELYLGSVLPYKELPKNVQETNDAFAETFKTFGYRNFTATEIRVKDKSYFTDPTFRMPGQSGEHLLETCENLPEIIWMGANGKLVEPKFKFKFAASASIHSDISSPKDWKVLRVPDSSKQWVKCCHYAVIDGLYHFPPYDALDLGVVIGAGNTIKETLSHLRKNIDSLSEEPVSFELDGFFDLLEEIRDAQKLGIKFCDEPIPSDKDVMEFIK